MLTFEVQWETFLLIAPVVKDEEVQKSCSEASTEEGGSGKGEVKEMNIVCGGSSPRDHAIKTTGPNYTIPHREWTPLLCLSPVTHPLLHTRIFVVSFFFLYAHLSTRHIAMCAYTLHHMRIQVIQLEERYTCKALLS